MLELALCKRNVNDCVDDDDDDDEGDARGSGTGETPAESREMFGGALVDGSVCVQRKLSTHFAFTRARACVYVCVRACVCACVCM